jgi:hypothetical protein
MLKLRLRLIGLFSTLVLVGAVGCSKQLESADAGVDHGTISDPAACGCQVIDYVLIMSWDCFIKNNDRGVVPWSSCTPPGQWTKGCGLSEYSVETIGGPARWVYDASGKLVGEQFGSDDAQFGCPTDPTMIGFSVRAGQFADSCDSAVTCQCSADGGSCDPTDAGLSLNDLF